MRLREEGKLDLNTKVFGPRGNFSSSLLWTASISKVLTAIGIMRLIEEEKKDLNTKVFGPR